MSSCSPGARRARLRILRQTPRYTRSALNSRFRRSLLTAAAVAAIAVASVLGLFYYRDNFATHLPARHLIGDLWNIGELPLWNPWIGGGQPLAGNANVLAFYPTGALQLLLPFGVAFNLHFWLHLAAAAWGTYAFRRIDGSSPRESAVTASLFVFSGSVISTTAFYNLVTATALVPLALAACALVLRRPSWRSGLVFGCTLGLFALAAEPLITSGTAILLLAFAAGRLARPHAGPLFISGVAALLVASPQLIAFAEVASELSRTRFGYSTETTLAASMHWWRLPEWLFGPVWGLATDLGTSGWSAAAPQTRWPPFLLHFTSTLLIVPALLCAIRRREWRWLAAGTALLFLALGSSNPLLAPMLDRFPSLRIGRFPEKFAIHLAFVSSLLVARWFSTARNRFDTALVGGVTAVVGGAVVTWLIGSGRPDAAVEQAFFWIALSCATALIVVRTMRERLRIAALLLPSIAAAAVSIPLDHAQPYLSRVTQQWPTSRITTRGNVAPPGGIENARDHYRLMATLPVPHFGTVSGAAYALDRSPEGMYSAASRLVQERSHSGDAARLERWAALNSVSAVIDLGSVYRGGVVRPVGAPLPRLWSPSRVLPAGTVHEGVQLVESESFVPGRDAVGAPSLSSSVQPLQILGASHLPGRLRIDVAATGPGLLVTDQTYFRSWAAETAEGRQLATVPINIDRLAVTVPAGHHTIDLVFGRYRTLIAASWGVSWSVLIAAALLAAQLRRSSHGNTAPAR